MSKNTPTPAQRAVLEKMAEGYNLSQTRYGKVRTQLWKPANGPFIPVRDNMVTALVDKGLILYRRSEPWECDLYWILTPAGRAAIGLEEK